VNEQKVQSVVALAENLKRLPVKWGWNITGVIYGHGKVIVQAVTPAGKAVQFVGKVKDA
jgi:hypothetical protein